MKALSVERSVLEGHQKVKELFAFVRDHASEATAYEAEQQIFTRVMQIGLTALQGYFAQKGPGEMGEELTGASGDRLSRVPGLRDRTYFSVFGKLEVPRTYYHAAGQPGVFPLDAQADLPERCYSYLLQEWMDLFSLRETFQEAEVSLSTLLGVQVGASRCERVSQDSSTSYDACYATKALPDPATEGALQVVEFDGKGVPLIQAELVKLREGDARPKTKEATMGVSYTVDPHVRTAEEVAERLIYPDQAKAVREARQAAGEVDTPPPKGQHIRRLASLTRSRAEVVEAIVADGRRRNPAQRRPWIVVMDGALGLWTVVAAYLTGLAYVGILDIMHVLGYLWGAGNALYGEQTPAARTWVYNHLLALLRGEVGYVIGGLKQTRTRRTLTATQQKAFTKAIRYFENHRQWMRYDEYLAAGYPIGSGVVESSCGHTIKDRMEGSGKRWSLPGAEAILLLRSVYTSGDWDDYWDTHMTQEHQRLYAWFGPQPEMAVEYGQTPLPQAVGM